MNRTLHFGRAPADCGREPVPWIEETRARGLLPRGPSAGGGTCRLTPLLATAHERSGWRHSPNQEDDRDGPRQRGSFVRSNSPSPLDWAAAVRSNFPADPTPAFYRTSNPGHFALRDQLENFGAQLEASIARQARKQARQRTPTFEGIGSGRTVPVSAIESDSEDDEEENQESRTSARPGSFHTRVFSVPPGDHSASQRLSFEVHRRRQEAEEGSALNIAVIQTEPEIAQDERDEEKYQAVYQSPSSSASVSPQPTVATVASRPFSPVSWPAPESAERSPTFPPPPCYASEPGSPYPDSLLSRLGSIIGLDLLGVDFALRDPSLAPRRVASQQLSPPLLSPQTSLPPSYHSSPYSPSVALSTTTTRSEERPLPELPEEEEEPPTMTQSYFNYPEASSSRTSHDGTRPPMLAMPVPHPTGHDNRRFSAPAVAVHIGYRAPPPPPPPMPHFPTSPVTSSAPPVPRRPNQPYIAPRPQTMPDTALRLRALSFASRSSMERPLPPLPPERSQSMESQAISLNEVDSPDASIPTSPVEERAEEEGGIQPPKPPPKPLLHYAYHPTHYSSYTRDVSPLPISLHPNRHPLPAVIPMPPPPAAFQILAPSFEELLQRLFESGASQIEPTPDVFEVADEAELTAWLRFFKVVPADGDPSRSGRRRLSFRRKSQSPEYRVVLGMQLADPKSLSRIESSSSSRVPPSPSTSGPSVPPPGATSQSGPNPLLDMSSTDDDSILESTWFVPVTFAKGLACPCSLATLGEALFKAEQESRQTGSRMDENGEKKLWQVIQSHRARASSFTENGVSNIAITSNPSVRTTASSDVRFEDADLVPRGKTKGLFRKMTMAVADAGSGVGALRTVTRERERERDLRANFVTPFRAASPS